MLISSMSSISLKTPHPERLAQFYRRVLGMSEAPGSSENAIRLGWGAGHYAVELRKGEHGLDHFSFEVVDDQARADLKARLAAAQVVPTIDSDTLPDGIAIRDPDGNLVKFHGEVDRSGEHSFGLRPDRIQHLAIATPDVTRLLKFYVDILGFRVSDVMGDDDFVWLRSDHYHHSLALVRRAGLQGLDHYSFDIAGWSEFKTWCDHLARHGISILWGPGRHGPGNNLFIMFRDTDGYLLEFSAEMELYWDDVTRQVPRNWQNVGRAVSLWGPWPDFRQEKKA